MESILDHIGNTPLVRLARICPDYPLYGKCEHLNPAGSIKDRLAKSLVEDGERRGLLKPGQTIVEATAGNTGMGLAMVAVVKGYRLVCVMPEKMSIDKRRSLQAMGAEVLVVPNAPLDSPQNFRQTARRLAQEEGWFLADQFRSQANVDAHFETTGPELFEQTDGRIQAFVAGVGTGGTITGVGRYLKARSRHIQIVLADPAGSALAGWVETGCYGPDSSYLVEGIGSSRAPEIFDRKVIDKTITIEDDESFSMALRLQREEGMLVGGSAGTAVAAALRLVDKAEGPVVALLADSWDRYFAQPWMAGQPDR